MENMEKSLNKFTNFISMETGKDQEVLLFGLRLLLSYIIGFFLIIIISYLLGIHYYTLTAAITASILRVFSGGTHASSQSRCCLLGILIFIPMGFIAKIFSPRESLLVLLILGILIYGLFAINKYAPAATPGKPISSQIQRNILRKYSFVVLILWGILCLSCLAFSKNLLLKTLIFSTALGMFWQLTSLTPFGYTMIKIIDSCLNLILHKKEVNVD
ncbi:MAG: accessory gene regulator B family protein [Dehalobacterium sp.]